ncbi:Son of sevenless 1 [Cymbomonas tetramitiformis]|uniref:Son of sevenless 1 n=1 Tax=Cymbomonas tetramitiformis TaxID=36881 RepID=A0AAE0FRD3_9CHLO|nr:Son of sevenless 1 [Cymbomonas tetramitiformis]
MQLKAFWETTSFIVNTIVFFYSGVSIANLLGRSIKEIYQHDPHLTTLWHLPLIYASLHVIRYLCLVFFKGLMGDLLGERFHKVKRSEKLFLCFAALRGAVNLIMAQIVATTTAIPLMPRLQMTFWTVGITLMTLVVNGPLVPLFLRISGISSSEDEAAVSGLRQQIVTMLSRQTQEKLGAQRRDVSLQAADWAAVQSFVEYAGENVGLQAKLERLFSAVNYDDAARKFKTDDFSNISRKQQWVLGTKAHGHMLQRRNCFYAN